MTILQPRLAANHPAAGPLYLFCLLSLLCLLCALPAPARATPLASLQDGQTSLDLAPHATLYHADAGQSAPASAAALPAMLAGLRPAAKVDLLGGSYWLHVELRNDSNSSAWVVDPNDTLIERVDIGLYGADSTVNHLQTGYRAPHDYMLHYGKDVALQPGQRYQLLLRFSSPYYARTPVFALAPQPAYQLLVARENVLTIAAIGALLALALFNFFIYSYTRDPSSLYYSLYVLSYAAGWGLTFHLGTDLFDWHELRVHYLPFFLLPVLSTLFYTRFLRLQQHAPRLYRLSRLNLVLPLLAMPSCYFALAYAHTLATIVIMVWMVLALLSGIVVWRQGYQPARFFVLGFAALMLPGLLILPANVGLIPAVVANAQLFTLLGGTLDGLLLAFALADQIRLLRNTLEQRVAERTTELNAAKEHAEVVSRHRIDFLSAMSHDIRTPLAGVIGMLKFAMRDASVRGRTEEYLRIGLQNGEALLTILNDILDYSKIDAGKLSVESVDFDLILLLDDAVAILQAQADAKSLLLRRDVALDLPRYVRGDPTRLRQILLNLLGNAIKFTDGGEVQLRVTALPAVPGEGGGGEGGVAAIRFAVSDTGPGIAPATLSRLFQKFEQADHSTTRRYGGTGLGLAICKELAELMGGAIGVDSRIGAGSTFHVTLPLAPGTAPPADPLAAPRRQRHAYRLSVLCAEDVRTNQIIIATLVEQMGHDIHLVENGLQALQALASASYDLVLMDGRMPLMDGEQAVRQIRAGGDLQYRVLDPTVPVIALTANASDLDRARYLAAGMDGFLSKPVDERLLFDQFEQTIARLLARGRTLRPASAEPAPPGDAELAAQFGVVPLAAEPAQGQALADPAQPETGPAAPASTSARQSPSDAACPLQPETIRILPLAGLSHKHLQRITQAFLDEAPRRLALVSQALAEGNAAAAAAALHALKGSAGYLSSSRLHELCHELEALAGTGALAPVVAALPQLEQALQQACAELRASPCSDCVATLADGAGRERTDPL
ncbi:hybrid sensor histidine kinase/response regulator [Rugamonas rubra]|uniref:Virulence sensor protein BvgS n=1 Tax=Rugamonas rubra TaxID=758825 RepID=A0A1I4IVY2_9BURK|nr:hybrid sensor histidine kinase/response regulator [Rugamonas rubra]SFL58529.1 Signal transduction histidine kinase [Rugamonas rubra]